MTLLHIVIPCFNEAKRMALYKFWSHLSRTTIKETIITFVNDGSTDHTLSKLLELQKAFPYRIQILNYSNNQGKAIAVRLGVLKAISSQQKSQLIAYLDADLAISLEECFDMVCYFKDNPSIMCCFSSRIKQADNIIQTKITRHFIGRTITFITHYILRIPIYDTQCGCKLFTTKISKKIFQEPFVSSWIFDIEIFARIIKTFPKKYPEIILEVPVKKWINHKESKVPISYSFKIIKDFYCIYKYLKVKQN